MTDTSQKGIVEPEEYAEFVFREKGVGYNTKKMVFYEDGRVSYGQLFIQKLMKDRDFVRDTNKMLFTLSGSELGAYGKRFTARIKTLALEDKETQEEAMRADERLDKSLQASINFKDYRLVIDVNTNEKCVMFVPEGTKCNMHPDFYTSQQAKEDTPWPVYALLEYDPYDLNPHKKIPYHTGEVVRLNRYIAPEWRKRPVDPNATCPEEVDFFLKHLFPNKEAREYVLDWMYTSVYGRCQTYLTLNGAKGVGKTAFFSIFKALWGVEHYSEAPRSFFGSQFNGILEDVRGICIDELESRTKLHYDSSKAYINKYLTLEKKHQNADKVIEMHASFVMASNAETDVYVEHDDRRFSVMDITTQRLDRVKPDSWTDDFIRNKLTDPDYVHRLGSWLTNRGVREGHTEYKQYRGEHFHKLVETSRAYWERFLVDLCRMATPEDYEGWDYRQLERLYKKEAPGQFLKQTKGIEDFLRNNKFHGREIARVEDTDEDGWKLIPLLCHDIDELEEEDDIL
jgi:hypothetical protein